MGLLTVSYTSTKSIYLLALKILVLLLILDWLTQSIIIYLLKDVNFKGNFCYL